MNEMYEPEPYLPCAWCNGDGTVSLSNDDDTQVRCSKCEGSGLAGDE